MGVLFLRGQQLGKDDLNIFLTNASGHPINAAEIYYAIFDFTTGMEVLVGPQRWTPANPSVGEYYASLLIPTDANIGGFRIRWTMREVFGGPVQTVVQEFTVQDRQAMAPSQFTDIQLDLVRSLRIALRDNDPDRNYRFRPPTHEATIDQFSRVFGYIWEDVELLEYLRFSLDMISASPPFTPFSSMDNFMQMRGAWRSLLIQGAIYWAAQAVQTNWISEEFGYSIGGVSLDLERSSKYGDLKQSASDQFEKMLEQAKATVKYIKGLQQPKYGAGIRSSFGPYTGSGVLTPGKFVGM